MISAQALPALVETGSKPDPVAPSGFVELDQLTGGMTRGHVWLVVGRPGEGSTTLIVQWARALAGRAGEHVHLVTPRDFPQSVAARLYSMSGLIPLNRLPTRLDEEAKERRKHARERVSGLSLSLYARGEDHFVPEIHPTRAAARPTAIVIDDADLVSGVTPRMVEQWARDGLFVLLSMPRSRVLPDNDWDVVPEWGRAADVVLEIRHRHLYEPSLLRPGGADLHVRYNRHGHVRTLAVQHQAHFSRFLESSSEGSPSS